MACGICYSYRLDAQVPDLVCDDARCAQPFHQTCLYEVRFKTKRQCVLLGFASFLTTVLTGKLPALYPETKSCWVKHVLNH